METRRHSTPAYLWDGTERLPGTLEIGPDGIVFRPDPFGGSHLQLYIRLGDVVEVSDFLILETSWNGLSIRSRSGKQDLFVLENPRPAKALLRQLMAK